MPILHFLGLLMVEFGMIGIIALSVVSLTDQQKEQKKIWLFFWLVFSLAAIFAGYALTLSQPNHPRAILLFFGVVTFSISAFQTKTSSEENLFLPMISWLILMFVGLFYASCYFAPNMQ